MDLGLVDDVSAVRSAQAPALDPGRGQEACRIGAGYEDPGIRGDDTVPLSHGEAERDEVIDVGGPAPQVGQNREVKVIESGSRLRQVLEGDAMRTAFKLTNECGVCLSSSGAEL